MRIHGAIDPDWSGPRRGDGVFTTIRIRDASAFDWRAHMERLARDAAHYDLGPAPQDEALKRTVARRLAEAELTRSEAIARIAFWRTCAGGSGAAATGVVVEAFAPKPAPAGLTTLVLADGAAPVTAKAAAYGPRFRARAEAVAAGGRDALILNAHGRVAGAPTANVFAIIGDRLITPPLSEGALAGTARAWLLARRDALGLDASVAPVSVEDAARADALVLTNALQGPRPARLEGAAMSKEGEAIGRRLRSLWGERLPETPLLP